jgi:3-oxoacyl-[acyl-carrier-protein] synthase III
MALNRVERFGLSFGEYIPAEEILNDYFAGLQTASGRVLDAKSILKRTGVERRFVANNCETTLKMASAASGMALEPQKSVDLVLAATSYPIGENLAQAVVDELGLPKTQVMEIGAACSGFTRGLNYLHENQKQFTGARVLFVTSERYSSTLAPLKNGGSSLDPSLAQTLFSDGAVAVVFTYNGTLSTLSSTNHRFPQDLAGLIKMPINRGLIKEPYIEEPVCPSERYFEQDGRKVFEEVIKRIPSAVLEEITKSGLQPSDIKWVVPHQGSGHMVDSLAKRLEVEGLNVFKDYKEGNLSSASIPRGLMRLVSQGDVETGSNLVLAGFGAGLFASTAVIRIG